VAAMRQVMPTPPQPGRNAAASPRGHGATLVTIATDVRRQLAAIRQVMARWPPSPRGLSHTPRPVCPL
jgi:hypothetical protein